MMTKTVSGEIELLLYPGDQIHVQIYDFLVTFHCWKFRIIIWGILIDNNYGVTVYFMNKPWILVCKVCLLTKSKTLKNINIPNVLQWLGNQWLPFPYIGTMDCSIADVLVIILLLFYRARLRDMCKCAIIFCQDCLWWDRFTSAVTIFGLVFVCAFIRACAHGVYLRVI